MKSWPSSVLSFSIVTRSLPKEFWVQSKGDSGTCSLTERGYIWMRGHFERIQEDVVCRVGRVEENAGDTGVARG